MEESSPPLRKNPSGTSLTSREAIALSDSRRVSLTAS